MTRTVCVCEDPRELAARAARRIAANAARAIRARGRFVVCLSGGDTPRATYRRLASAHRDDVAWDTVHVFWGDERCIPLDRPDNHFTMATETLLSHTPIPAKNVHRLRGEAGDPARAADEYEATLRGFFGDLASGSPTFDLVILGMGEDGHVASIFPGSDGEAELDRWVVDHWITKHGERLRRLTVTLNVLSAAREIMILVSGETKAEMLATVLEEGTNLPAGRIDAAAADVVWMVDAEAAGALRRQRPATGERR